MSLTKRLSEAQAAETPAERLSHIRQSLRFALRAAADGQPSIETLCDIERALTSTLREMEQLQITLAVIERQHEM